MNDTELRKQLELCMGCGYCRDAYGDEGWLESLKTKHVCPVREILGFDSYTAKGRILLGKAILEEEIPMTPTARSIFYQCTLCGNCEAHCISRGLPFVPSDLKVREIIRYFREKIIEDGLEIPKAYQRIAFNLKQTGNVFGERQKRPRMPYLEENKDASIMYFAGCMVSYRESQVLEALNNVCKKLNLKIGILPEELCCGNVLLRTGQIEVAKSLMESNKNHLNEAGFKILVTSCPGCFSALKNEYPKYEFKLNFEVQHITEYFSNLPQLKDFLKNSKPIKVTYHDPCELGRLNKIFLQPRKILQTIPNVQLIEPFRSQLNAWCCGAGAGVQAAYPDLSKKIAFDRYKELKDTAPDCIITACPNCVHSLSQFGQIMDIIEIIERYII